MIDRLDRTIRWNVLNEIAAWAVEQAITLQQIPAPTFAEKRRAEHVADLFRGFDLEQVDQDDLYNVYGLIPGTRRGAPAVMVSAHTDTVFPETTDLTLKRDGDLLIAPGIGDNCMGVAGVLGLISLLRREGITPVCDLWIVATTREEGLGDLGGMRAAFARLKPLVGSVINVEGLAFGHVYHAGIAVRRLKITAHTAGGHSWLHFGRPSAIHSLIQLGAQIVALPPPPTQPRTTYNIGIIEGGQSINSIATEASFWLDLRSEDSKTLANLEQGVRAEIAALTTADVTFDVQVVGDRPSGDIAPDHPLVQRALDVLKQVGVHGTLETGSTDGNVPLSEGCPTVTVGITRGGNAHRLDEYVEIGPVAAGIRQLILLTLTTTDASA